MKWVSVHRVVELMEITNKKYQIKKKLQHAAQSSALRVTEIQNIIILKKDRRIEKDIFINTGKIELVKIIGTLDSCLPLE